MENESCASSPIQKQDKVTAPNLPAEKNKNVNVSMENERGLTGEHVRVREKGEDKGKE